MSLLQMSFSGAVMIIVILLVRMVAINKLPKIVFVVLWEIAFLRLLIPISVPSVFSAYSMIRENHITQEVFTEGPVSYLIPEAQEVQFAVPALIPEAQEIQSAVPALIPETQEVQSAVPALIPEAQEIQSAVSANIIEAMQHEMSAVPGKVVLPVAASIPLWMILWIAGIVICVLFFLITYLRCYREFRMSLPVSNAFTEKWLKEHQIKRGIRIRQSDRISSPLTYGIFRPVILMPKTTDWEDLQRLQYVLQHEYVHIRRFDMIRKLVAALVLCIHWFNPAVWIMYLIYNRDIELSCDERVIREFGESSKPLYAKALIAMEEKRNSLQPLSNSFSKNAIEERIKAVMKTKKVTVWAAIISIAVIAVIAIVFATSANIAERDEQVSANLAGENIFSFSGDQYFPLIIDDDIVLNDLFIQFIEGDANAYSYGEEKNIFDYYEEYSVREINVVHFMAEDLNGDGEDELLININWTYYEGIILAFHCQDGDLFEWESISYGMHSPEVTLYPDVNIVEVTGTGWTRSFYTYNSQGEKMQIFSCSSIEDNLEDGSFRRQYLITVYQDGIAKEEYSVEEIFDENDNVVFVSSEEETLIFHGVLDDFLNMLGEGKQISSTQNDVEVTDTVISGNANSTNNTDDYVPDDEWEAVTAVTGEDVIAFFDTITEDMLDACDEYPSVESYWTDPIVLLDSGRLYGIRANGQEAMLIYRDGEKILIEHPFGNLYQERPNLHIGNIDNDAMYEMTISFRTITGNIKRYGMIVCDYTNNTWNVYEYDDYLKDIEEAI